MSDTMFTLKHLVASTLADVEIFLLMEEDQRTYKNKIYSKEEILLQLEKTGKKVLAMLKELGADIDDPIMFDAFKITNQN